VVAAKYVASAEPDGHLISIYTSAFTVAPLLNPGTIDRKELTRSRRSHRAHGADRQPVEGLQERGGSRRRGEGAAGQLVASNAGIGSSTHMNFERFRLAAGIGS